MSVDAELTLDMIRVQLLWLEREMMSLRRLIGRQDNTPLPVSAFEALEGIWHGMEISEDDIDSSELTLPEDL